MATKKEIRHYAEKHGITREEAKQHFINEAIKRNREARSIQQKGQANVKVRHSTQQNTSKRRSNDNLIGFYWGYKAQDRINGYEFSQMNLMMSGMSLEQAVQVGKDIKQVSDEMVNDYVNDTTVEKYGMTRDEFAKEEQQRMRGTARSLANMGPVELGKAFPELIVFCCAVSVCVAAGLLKQDTWNGDSFMFDGSGLLKAA